MPWDCSIHYHELVFVYNERNSQLNPYVFLMWKIVKFVHELIWYPRIWIFQEDQLACDVCKIYIHNGKWQNEG